MSSCVFEQVFNDAVEALRVSYRKMNPFCVPFATTNMGSAMLAMDLVRPNLHHFLFPAAHSFSKGIVWLLCWIVCCAAFTASC
jgi:hypothetical protein